MIDAVHIKDLEKRYHENKLAHAFLLETNDVERCYKDIIELIKIINCPHSFMESCTEECNLCHLIDTSNLPSLVNIEPDGQFIRKNQILEMMDKFSTKPVFSKFNMYVIKNADRFNSSSANTILKFLEEPEDNILGFFITTNKENVISTIRSRCQVIACSYNIDESTLFDNEYIDEVKIFLNSIYKNTDDLLYNRTNMSSLYKQRSEWEEFFYTMLYYIRDCYSNDKAYKIEMLTKIDKSVYIKIIILIEEIVKMIKANCNVDLVLDKFVIEMRCFYE